MTKNVDAIRRAAKPQIAQNVGNGVINGPAGLEIRLPF
jgi:hypothetical protein